MSFGAWFKNWIRAFCKLMTFDYRKPKSVAQRKREHERRLKAKHSSANLYRINKRNKQRRSSKTVQDEKMIKGLFGFIGASLGILLLPLGLLDWGRKSTKLRKASRGRGVAKKTASKSSSKSSALQSKKVLPKTQTKKNTVVPSRTTVKALVTHTTTKPTASTASTPRRLHEPFEPQTPIFVVEAPVVTEPDENTPKSKPKHEKDQYIRKRMIIAGSSHCDKDVLETLSIGTCFDVALETDNPHDKEAVKLTYNGQKIGYISKADKPAFVTCLKLGRKVYGVITDINTETFPTQYEFETWFDSNK